MNPYRGNPYRGIPTIFEVLDLLPIEFKRRVQERIDWWTRFLYRWYFLTGDL
jgi:hypothetical protein